VSDNYTIITQPKLWASAHKPIEFVYDMPFQTGDVDNSGGFANVLLGSALAGGKTIVAGDIIYISSGVYLGYHVVKSVDNNLDFVLETAYISFASSVTIKYATPPQWQIWKGYQDSEVIGTNYFPFTKVADFAPEGNIDGYLSFNIGGYVKSAMKPIEPPLEGANVGVDIYLYSDVSLWQPYRLLIGTNPDSLYFERIYLALNSSIESNVLNAEYLNTSKALNSLPFINSCGTTFVTGLTQSGVFVYRVENGGVFPNDGDFSSDFNSDFFIV
jgi:hypothetical protein